MKPRKNKTSVEDAYKCELCEKSFERSEERDFHEAIEPHCADCGDALTDAEANRKAVRCRVCRSDFEGDDETEDDLQTQREYDSELWH